MSTTTDYSNCGALYYASGDKWIEEAQISAASLKRQMPSLPIAIVCNEELPQALFDIQIRHDPNINIKQLKMWSMLQFPFEKTLYLDTDTYICESVWEIFPILDRFDLAATITPQWFKSIKKVSSEQDVFNDGIPMAFPMFNGGVIAYRKNERVSSFLQDWSKLQLDWGLGQDQPSLRVSLYKSKVQFSGLSPHYNYRLPYPWGIAGVVKIIHGHNHDIDSISEKLNQILGWRITYPHPPTFPQISYQQEPELLDFYTKWEEVARDITSLIPAESPLILVHDNTLDVERALAHYRLIPFLERNGQYWGAPANDAIAISELERLRSEGIEWLAFAWLSFWWLDYYQEFHQYLRSQFRQVLANECLVMFNLRS